MTFPPAAPCLRDARAAGTPKGRKQAVGDDPKNWTDRPERQVTWYPAELLRDDGQRHRVFVTNLSGSGLRLTGCTAVAIGEICELIVPENGMFQIQIRWAIGGDAGARFLN